MARGKRSRPRDGGPEEELATPELAEEANGKRVHEEKAEGAAEELDAKEDDAGRELLLSQCKAILKLLMEHKHGWLFNEPVDPKKLEIPDYPSVIKHPMDLGTVNSKLDKNEYRDIALEYAKDVRLTFENAMLYNPPGHEVHNFAKKLLALFEKEWSKKKATKTPPPKTPLQKSSFRALSFEEKQNLLENLQTLPPHMQHEAVLLMTQKSPHVDWSSEEVDVQLDLMDNQALHEIDEHIKECMKTASSEKRVKQANKARSKGKQQKGKDKPGDEEEDIGIVIDVPLSLFSAQKVK